MKQDYVIPLGGIDTGVVEIRASRLRIRPARCLACGHTPETDEVVRDMGREFAEFIYNRAEGRFWDGMQDFFRQHP